MTERKCTVDRTTPVDHARIEVSPLDQLAVLFVIALGIVVGVIGVYALFSNGNGDG